MKKIFTLIAGAIMAVGSAFATVPAHKALNVSPADLQFGKVEKVMASDVMDPLTSKVMNGRSNKMKITAADGSEWATIIAVRGAFAEFLDGLKFEEYPYYYMLVAFQDYNSDNFAQLIITWPCYAALEEDCSVEDEDGYPVLDKDACIAKFGSYEKACEAVTYDYLAELMGGQVELYMYPGLYYTPSIVSAEWAGIPINWNGGEYMPISASKNADDKWDFVNATNIVWSKFDEDTSDIDIDFTIPYASFTGSGTSADPYVLGSRAGIAANQLSGPAVVLGFANISVDNIGEAHIFNGGRMEWGLAPESWNYKSFVSPLTYYFLCFCDASWGYMATNSQTGEPVYNFTDKTIPKNTNFSNPVGAPSYHFTDGPLNFFHATLWADENSELPYGLWSMEESDYTYNEATKTITYNSPAKAYNLVEALNCGAGLNDGFSGCYEGYTQTAVPTQSWIGVGDKDYGLNFKFVSTMTGGKYITGSFKGNIIYHPTPNKWVEDMSALPAVGTETFNALNEDSSVASVISDSPVVSSTYYNFQGQRLSSEPQHGIYIVRSVKADGSVVAKKVAK